MRVECGFGLYQVLASATPVQRANRSLSLFAWLGQNLGLLYELRTGLGPADRGGYVYRLGRGLHLQAQLEFLKLFKRTRKQTAFTRCTPIGFSVFDNKLLDCKRVNVGLFMMGALFAWSAVYNRHGGRIASELPRGNQNGSTGTQRVGRGIVDGVVEKGKPFEP